jgi:hypothetical protein
MKTFALPAAAGTVQSEVFDMFEAKTKNDVLNIHAQFEVSLPNITPPASTTLTVTVESSYAVDFATDRQSHVLGTLTAGAHADVKFQTKPSEKPKRYWRAVITTSGATGNLSASIAEFAIVF